ncbi:MAG: hypothetical protein E7I45_03100 [Eikenella corrodens]|uniref:hypothetical protein n=1 Tax=Eikenella corrodens TaxID=539 RepID=UPI00206933E9|nr:hypothetical protein [Eikenella corrodens]MDU4299948.1 hypothetical protein [Eikenella corrodens]DAY18192.1 MAG TPA: hypothetical protein [Caudoviricetes sp.]
MSAKIDIRIIISNHLKTLADTNGKVVHSDYFIFFGLPSAIAIFFAYKSYVLNSNVVSTLINFGAIFSALLISVLIMVYDQYQKLCHSRITNEDIASINDIERRKTIIQQMYHNISYCILLSIILVVCALLYQAVEPSYSLSRYVLMPLNVFITGNLLLTILMVLKRTYLLITTTKA